VLDPRARLTEAGRRTRRTVARGARTVCSPAGLRGTGQELAWVAAHAAMYPLGVLQEKSRGSARESAERFTLDDLPPVQRGLLMGDVVAAGTPILLVHGLVDNRSIFTLLRRALQRRGFGRVLTLNYSPFTQDVQTAAQRLERLVERTCEETGYERVHVVGHSLGGPIALALALVAPERVRSLALLCTVACGRDATRLSGRMLWLGLRSSVGTRRLRRRAFLEIVLPREAVRRSESDELAARLEPLFGHDLAERPPVAMKQFRALRAYDASARLGELAGVPTLVVSAEHDPIAPPRFGRALAAGVSGARFVEIAGASHGVTIQCAEPINALLQEHLTRAEEQSPRLTEA